MRTDDNLKAICDNLRSSFGDFHASCRAAGLSVDFVCGWIKDDTVAAQAIEEAQRVGYMGLESVAIKRAVHGVEKAVYYKGEVVGYDTNYSDGLLVKVMETRIPAYKKGEAGNNTFNGPTQINIMPRAENFDQWLEMKNATLKQRAADKLALSAPTKVPEILQGDYVHVTDAQLAEVAPLASLRGML